MTVRVRVRVRIRIRTKSESEQKEKGTAPAVPSLLNGERVSKNATPRLLLLPPPEVVPRTRFPHPLLPGKWQRQREPESV